MAYPQYKAINDEYDIALLIDNTNPDTIAAALNRLLSDTLYADRLRQHCIAARKTLNWENEEKTLTGFYHALFNKEG